MAFERVKNAQVFIGEVILNSLASAGFEAGGWCRIKKNVRVRANLYTIILHKPGERKSSGFGPDVQPVNR